MSLPRCGECGEVIPVGVSLMVHYRTCKANKAQDKPTRKPQDIAPTIKESNRGRPRKHTKCKVCGAPHHAKGLCMTHYAQSLKR